MRHFIKLVLLGVLFCGCLLFGGVDGVDHKTIFPDPIRGLHAPHTQGDRDFWGHGPSVKATAKLYLKENNTELWIHLYLCEEETEGDHTRFEGNWDVHLWTFPVGYTIEHICTDVYSESVYEDDNHGWDYPQVSGLLVKTFEIKGDDVGDDDACMNVYLNPITMKIKKK